MAGSFNGIGTTYYGECDYRADGSYVTTEWFIVAFFPVFPIASHRVARNHDGDKSWIFYNTTSYFMIEKLRVNWRQALRI